MSEPGGLTQRDIMLRTLNGVEALDGRLRNLEIDVAKLVDVREQIRDHGERLEKLEAVSSQRDGASTFGWKVATLGIGLFSLIVLMPGAVLAIYQFTGAS